MGLEPCAASFKARAIHVHQALTNTITTLSFERRQHQTVSVHFGLLMAIYTDSG